MIRLTGQLEPASLENLSLLGDRMGSIRGAGNRNEHTEALEEKTARRWRHVS